jgi:hypothetical protein
VRNRRHPAALAAASAAVAAAAVLGGCSDGGGATGQDTPTTAGPTTTATATSTAGATGTPGAGATASASASASSDDGGSSAVGEVVQGFPTDVVPVPPGAEVKVSTVAAADGRRQVSLAGETDQPADAVLAFYRDALVKQGFAEAQANLPPGVVGATFSRADGAEILTLSVVSNGGRQQFSIGGTIAG